MIRKASVQDISRIAEILVFDKRINFRPIFQDDDYSFNELQVLKVAQAYARPEILDHMLVYDDGIVKGLLHIEGTEIAELYVDHFFQGQGIGAELIGHAKDRYGADPCGPSRRTKAPSGFTGPTAFIRPARKSMRRAPPISLCC